MKNYKAYKNSSGITLVALAITIIVLLILATISIMSLTGDDGTINQAIEAKDSADYKQAKTEVNEEWYILQNEERKQDNSTEEMRNKLQNRLNKRLDDEEEIDESAAKYDDATVAYNESKRVFEVSYKGKDIELSLEGEPTDKEKSQEENDNIKITSHPQNVETLEGLEASFSVTATVTGDVQYQWYYNSKDSTVERIAGATRSTYTIPQTSLSNDGCFYYCEITSRYQGVTTTKKTDTAKLTVKERIKDITIDPAELIIAKGKTIHLEAKTSGTETITYQWFKNDSNSNQGGTQVTEATNSSTYEKANAELTDTGYYYCTATQTYGSLTNTVTSATVSVTVINSEVTYEYGINQHYPAETYTDTGYKINWDNDFTIETTVNVQELGKRYLVFGGFDNSGQQELNIEIYNSNQLRVYIGNGRTT